MKESWVDRLARRTGVMYGTYRGHHPRISRMPLWVGPVGGTFREPLTLRTWVGSWRGACGVEVAVFGRTAYVIWDNR